jgi:hypothetical protein
LPVFAGLEKISRRVFDVMLRKWSGECVILGWMGGGSTGRRKEEEGCRFATFSCQFRFVPLFGNFFADLGRYVNLMKWRRLILIDINGLQEEGKRNKEG